MKNVEDLFWAAPLDQQRVPGVITYPAETKKMGREESKASPVLLNNVLDVFSYDRGNNNNNNKKNQMPAGLSLKFL